MCRSSQLVSSPMEMAVLHLSMLLKSKLVDRGGENLGRVEDLIVRLADGAYPPVTGLKARRGRARSVRRRRR